MNELRPLRVLIACEESQTVCKEFRARGHEAYSCDLQACSGGRPDWHIMHDAVEVAYSGCWDLMVAHPPCRFLSNAGIRYFNEERYGARAKERKIERDRAAQFFLKLMNAPIPKVAIENPVGWMNSFFRLPNQTIHPYFFGDPHLKRTSLWLRGLPRLNGVPHEKPKPLVIQERRAGKHYNGGEVKNRYFSDAKSVTTKERSKTFPGIACAMAAAWSPDLLSPPESKV